MDPGTKPLHIYLPNVDRWIKMKYSSPRNFVVVIVFWIFETDVERTLLIGRHEELSSIRSLLRGGHFESFLVLLDLNHPENPGSMNGRQNETMI